MRLYGIRAKSEYDKAKAWRYLTVWHRKDDALSRRLEKQVPGFNGKVARWTPKRILEYSDIWLGGKRKADRVVQELNASREELEDHPFWILAGGLAFQKDDPLYNMFETYFVEI